MRHGGFRSRGPGPADGMKMRTLGIAPMRLTLFSASPDRVGPAIRARRENLDPRLFISLLTPLLALLLSAAFAAWWLLRRDSRYVGLLAIAYLAVSGAFLGQILDPGLGYLPTRFLSNLLFITAISLLVVTVLYRRKLPLPLPALGAIIAVTVAVIYWYTWPEDNFLARVVAINIGLGALCLVGVLRLGRAPGATAMDRMIMAVLALGIVNFLVRPLAEVAWGNNGVPMPDILSPYWLITGLTTNIYGLLVALTMLATVALDTIRELQAQTLTDPLSRLLNRRGFQQQAAQVLDSYRDKAMPLALVMIDLDHFKTINDHYGHAAGDKVISAFAQRLIGATGPHAIAGRLGGEEFAVLLPLTDLNGARLFSEAVRAFRGDVDGIGVTASFGVVQWRRGETLDHLLSRGDAALYQAKRGGRDRVQISDDNLAPPPRRTHFS